MAAADHGGRGLDHYQLLGVPREASRQEIAQAWRRRVRDEHPDARPCDADAPGRFRALAEAYRVLGDPARRGAYDRALAREPQTTGGARVTERQRSGVGGPNGITPGGKVPGPPLRAGPVRVDGGPAPQGPHIGDERDITLALLAELAVRCLATDRSWPW